MCKVLPGSSFMEAVLNPTTPLLITCQGSALPHSLILFFCPAITCQT